MLGGKYFFFADFISVEQSKFTTSVWLILELAMLQAVPSSHQESAEPKIRSDAYGQVAPPYLYDSPVAGPAGKTLPLMQGNGHLSRDYGLEGQASSASILSQQGRQGHLPSPPTHDAFISNNEDVMQMERKRKVL